VGEKWWDIEDLLAAYRSAPERPAAAPNPFFQGTAQEWDDAAQAAEEAKRREKRALREQKWRFWLRLLRPWLILIAVIWGVWHFLAAPAIHYHSLSVACSAHDGGACYELRQY
jgi:hypothetical protein